MGSLELEEEVFVGGQARAPAPAQAVVSDGAWLDAGGTSAVIRNVTRTRARTERGSQRKELLINQLTLRLKVCESCEMLLFG